MFSRLLHRFKKSTLPTRDIAWRVAKTTQTAVFARCCQRLAEMALPEARGYVRARGGLMVRAQLAEATRGRQLTPEQAQELHEATLQLVVEGVLSQHLLARRTLAPMRRAA